MDDFDENLRGRRYNAGGDTFGVHSTAGAVPVRNKKGEISMQKVKVQRYISGKRPDYARGKASDSEEDESDEEDFSSNRHSRHVAGGHHHHRSSQQHHARHRGADDDDEEDDDRMEDDVPHSSTSGGPSIPDDVNDPRIRRLREAKAKKSDSDDSDEDRLTRHRRIHQPEVLSDGDESDRDRDDVDMGSDESSSGEDDLDEEGIQRRRDLMRQRALARAQIGVGQEELMDKEEEKSGSDDDEEETSEEETTDSEEEEGARLKPVFVRKKDRLTVQEREREEARARQAEREAQLAAEQRRRETLRMVEESVKKETVERKTNANDPTGLNDVNTDDENEEFEYEAWKLRELKRLKRDREEREAMEREAAEVERLRSMTEEERRMELKLNPKFITNKAAKGKYKFLQKYYHRGVFFLDKEEGVFTRDYSAATLEDKFDKTVLPKVMQVKNFGRSGRTKYTHLVDQDTTQFDSPWTQETTQNHKFQVQHAGGTKPVFERPSLKKKK